MADLIGGLHEPTPGKARTRSLLGRVAWQAVRLFDGVRWAAITAVIDAAPVVVASTARRALIVDSHQHSPGGGPIRQALTTDSVIAVDHALLSREWPLLAETAGQLGIRSMTCVPLHVDSVPARQPADPAAAIPGRTAIASLTLYGAADEIPVPDHDYLTVLAFHAEKGLATVGASGFRTTARSVTAALDEFGLVAQAAGVLMATYGFTCEYAHKVLLDQAQDWDRTPTEQAAYILTVHHHPPTSN